MSMAWTIEIDRFACTDGDGNAVEVIVRQQVSEVGMNVTQDPPTYVTADGRSLRRIDRSTFRLPTGEILTRRPAGDPRP
jgi:hypothetical protein